MGHEPGVAYTDKPYPNKQKFAGVGGYKLLGISHQIEQPRIYKNKISFKDGPWWSA